MMSSKNTDAASSRKAFNAQEAGQIAEMVAAKLKKPDATTEAYTAKRNGKILGVLQLDTYGAEKGHPVTIDWLASHPDVILGNIKEKGIGTELFRHAVQRAADLGVGLKLQSAAGARSFYEKMGMRPDEELEDHYTLGPKKVKAIAKGQK